MDPTASRSSGDSVLVTNIRTSAASVPTTELSVDVEKCAETRTIWAIAVTPTIARKTPKTMMKRTGRGMRRGVPNMVG